MRKMRFRTLISVLTATTLMAGMLTGCQSKNTEEPTKPQETGGTATSDTSASADGGEGNQDVVYDYFDPSQVTEPITIEYMKKLDEELEWKDKTDPITLDVFYNAPAGYEYPGWGNDMVSQEITNRTGVSLNFTFAQTTENEQLNTLMASNKLPDLIVTSDNAIRAKLIEEEMVYSLDELIDQYCPRFRTIIPKRQNILFTEADGKMYTLANWFGDPQMMKDIKGRLPAGAGLVINKEMYAELGSPKMDTLDEYFDVLMMAKEKWPDMPYYVFDSYNGMDDLISRIYGGQNMKVIEDDKVHMNFRDESYQNAIKFINKLYRAGLYNPENFAVTSEQYVEAIKNNKIFSHWGWCANIMAYDMTMDTVYEVVEVPEVEGYEYRITDMTGSMGLGSVYISKNCKDPERAILLLEFLASMEGQLLNYYGVEDRDFTIEEGVCRRSDEIEAARADFSKFTQEYGIVLGMNNLGVVGNFIDHNGYYWSGKTNPLYNGLYKYEDEARDEFINTCITIPAGDTEMAVVESNIMKLWQTYRPKFFLAESEEACMEEYNKFIKEAESIGLNDLEEAYTTRYLELKNAGF